MALMIFLPYSHTQQLMQFQLLLNASLKNNQQYLQLLQRLAQKEERCLAQANSDNQRQKCRSKGQHFQQYFEQYMAQFKEKGRNMCNSAMKEHDDLEQKIILKDECISFYAKSIPLFEGNVIDKLKSLVQNTDFSEL